MSRGLGSVERRILEVLVSGRPEHRPDLWFRVEDLDGVDRQSVSRAIHRLAEKGHVEYTYVDRVRYRLGLGLWVDPASPAGPKAGRLLTRLPLGQPSEDLLTLHGEAIQHVHEMSAVELVLGRLLRARYAGVLEAHDEQALRDQLDNHRIRERRWLNWFDPLLKDQPTYNDVNIPRRLLSLNAWRAERATATCAAEGCTTKVKWFPGMDAPIIDSPGAAVEMWVRPPRSDRATRNALCASHAPPNLRGRSSGEIHQWSIDEYALAVCSSLARRLTRLERAVGLSSL